MASCKYKNRANMPSTARGFVGLPPELVMALSMKQPGLPRPPGPRMNPWHCAGAVPAERSSRMTELLAAMWQPDGWHFREDGTPTAIARRPVPSAGATYGVHTHLVVGADGHDVLDQGRYVYDPESGLLLRRNHVVEAEVGWPAALSLASRCGTHLVFSIQPGRAFGRYRHRAWPLWIADVAYALEAVRFLVRADLPAVFGPSSHLRVLTGMPKASDLRIWLARGLIPEIPLVSVLLPEEWTLNADRSRALARRRSPSGREFKARPVRDVRARCLAKRVGQEWIAHADHVVTWELSVFKSATMIGEALWQAHLAAARLTYEIALEPDTSSRSISGIPASEGIWIMHAVAILNQHAHPIAKNS